MVKVITSQQSKTITSQESLSMKESEYFPELNFLTIILHTYRVAPSSLNQITTYNPTLAIRNRGGLSESGALGHMHGWAPRITRFRSQGSKQGSNPYHTLQLTAGHRSEATAVTLEEIMVSDGAFTPHLCCLWNYESGSGFRAAANP